jgi:hypothetical protein
MKVEREAAGRARGLQRVRIETEIESEMMIAMRREATEAERQTQKDRTRESERARETDRTERGSESM